LKEEAIRFFNSLFQDTGHNYIEEQIDTIRLFPRIVTEEEVVILENPCSSEEVLEVLKCFSKDKSPGPDGWTLEFFIHFYKLVGKDSFNAMEETRLSGAVIRSINSTEVVPTRRNGRTRVEEIAKRLDKSYVSEDLISSSMRYTSWVDYPYISDYAPVLLQLGNSILIVAHPFKLNLAWLREDTFATLVQEVWYDYQFQQEEGA
jgi:hypothetical protein